MGDNHLKSAEERQNEAIIKYGSDKFQSSPSFVLFPEDTKAYEDPMWVRKWADAERVVDPDRLPITD